jgi:hypothetical protein
MLRHLGDGVLKPVVFHRLQQIIHSIGSEGIHGKGIIGRDEHDGGHIVLLQSLHHVETREARHLDVEEHEVWCQLGNGSQRFLAVLAGLHHLNLRILLKAHAQATARQRLIVDNDRPYRQAVFILFHRGYQPLPCNQWARETKKSERAAHHKFP